MIWEFKQRLFVTQRRVSLAAVADMSNPSTRRLLQSHIDSLGGLPAAGTPDEYAALFEAAYPAESDRRAYIESKLAGAKPSYGHVALAGLLHSGLARIVWTTNFDPMVADACAHVYGGTGSLTTVTLDSAALAAEVMLEERWPIEIKLHGDFRSRRLKNTSDELRTQDAHLRHQLIESCKRFGLIIVGYSGRDSSVMDALAEVVRDPNGFPGGLFWMHRADAPPPERVEKLLADARGVGIEAATISIANFDEALRDLIRLTPVGQSKTLHDFAAARRRWTGAPVPTGKTGWPIIRLNAIPVTEAPAVCRRVECSVGGTREAREAAANSKSDILVARVRAGVLAFGSDDAVRAAFHSHGVASFDLHPIEASRLRYDSGERGLLRDALTRALTRERSLAFIRRRNTDLLYPLDAQAPRWKPLARIVGPLRGTIPGNSSLAWHEGVGTRLDWADDRLWLLFEPRIVFDGVTEATKSVAADFGRERTVRRYNRELNALIEFWASFLAGTGEQLRALGIGDGVDAVFRLSSTTAFSRRAGA